jgi:hypothetical protein
MLSIMYVVPLGYFYFEECGNTLNPTIGLEFGETYTFIQKDRTNFMHPLTFSYFPDGHHVGGDLLDPATAGQSTTGVVSRNGEENCSQNMTCPSPMYMLNNGYLGKYSNIPEIKPVTINEDHNGINIYESMFFKKMAQWTGYGTFTLRLKFDDYTFTDSDIFYYCHMHQFMAGRIKLLKDGVPVNSDDSPPLYFQRETPGEFDAMCGVSKTFRRFQARHDPRFLIRTVVYLFVHARSVDIRPGRIQAAT